MIIRLKIMIPAFHRVSSNQALETIMAAGQIVPAAYRIDPELVQDLCSTDMLRDNSGPGVDGVRELVEEAAAYFRSVQAEFPGPKTRATALKCQDILSGDGGRIFLSPGTWSEAGRALGWPLSGFVFDAEQLIKMGARFRKDDLYSTFWVLMDNAMNASSRAEAKEIVLGGLHKIHDTREMGGEDALQALEMFRLLPGEEAMSPHERQKYEWRRGTEVVWDGPLPLDLALEVWKNDKVIWAA